MLWLLTDEEEREAIEEMGGQPDRVVAIVNAAIIETRLDAAIRTRLIDDEKGELHDTLLSDARGLGSLGTKNHLAFALGLYGESARKDIHQLKEIRNAFAHKLAVKSFSESPVRDRCANLALVDRYIFDRDVPDAKIDWVRGMTLKVEDRNRLMGDPRARFQSTAALVMNGLHLAVSTPMRPPTPAF